MHPKTARSVCSEIRRVPYNSLDLGLDLALALILVIVTERVAGLLAEVLELGGSH